MAAVGRLLLISLVTDMVDGGGGKLQDSRVSRCIRPLGNRAQLPRAHLGGETWMKAMGCMEERRGLHRDLHWCKFFLATSRIRVDHRAYTTAFATCPPTTTQRSRTAREFAWWAWRRDRGMQVRREDSVELRLKRRLRPYAQKDSNSERASSQNGPNLNHQSSRAQIANQQGKKGERSLPAAATAERTKEETKLDVPHTNKKEYKGRRNVHSNPHIATVYDFIGRGGDSNLDYLYPPTVDEKTGGIAQRTYYADSLFKDETGKVDSEDDDEEEDFELFEHRQSAHPNSKHPSSWLMQFTNKAGGGASRRTIPIYENDGYEDSTWGEMQERVMQETVETTEAFGQPPFEDPTGEFMSSDPKLVKAFNSTGLLYEVVRIDANDDMTITQTEKLLSRRSLLKMSGLRPRDLRRVDPSLSLSTAGPDMSVRQNMMLINIGSVKAIVTNQSAIIFKHPSFTCKRFLRLLGNRIQANFRYAMSSDWEERKLQVPFELVVGEAALISSSSPLEFDLLKAQPLLTRYVNRLKRKMTKAGVAQETLEQVRQFKQKLITVESRAQAMRSMLMEMLDDEEDLQRLALSAIKVKGGDELTKEEEDQRELYIEEWEMLLEYYLLRYETISSEASRMLEEARDLEETVSLTLSSRRLQISRLELLLSVCSLSVATGAMIAGVFGMNLLSGYEQTKGVFWGVFFGIVAGAGGMAWAITSYMRRQGML